MATCSVHLKLPYEKSEIVYFHYFGNLIPMNWQQSCISSQIQQAYFYTKPTKHILLRKLFHYTFLNFTGTFHKSACWYSPHILCKVPIHAHSQGCNINKTQLIKMKQWCVCVCYCCTYNFTLRKNQEKKINQVWIKFQRNF